MGKTGRSEDLFFSEIFFWFVRLLYFVTQILSKINPRMNKVKRDQELLHFKIKRKFSYI